MNAIQDYHRLRQAGLSFGRCCELSGVGYFIKKAANFAAFVVCIACILFLWSDQANALTKSVSSQAAHKVSEQGKEIDALRWILAQCMGDKEGLIWIGDEAHFCKAVPTGIKR